MTYLPIYLPVQIRLAATQRPKDELVIDRITPYFRPGAVLEIGAGCGQLSELLRERGIPIVSSDLEPFFVDYQRSRGLTAQNVNALSIVEDTGKQFHNILTQGVSTLVTTDLEQVEQTYRSVRAALMPGGRFVFIFPNAYRKPNWSTIDDHRPIIERVGLSLVAQFRSQMFPSQVYHMLPTRFAKAVEELVGSRLGIRHVLIMER